MTITLVPPFGDCLGYYIDPSGKWFRIVIHEGQIVSVPIA